MYEIHNYIKCMTHVPKVRNWGYVHNKIIAYVCPAMLAVYMYYLFTLFHLPQLLSKNTIELRQLVYWIP